MMVPRKVVAYLLLLVPGWECLEERSCTSSEVCRKAKSCSWYNKKKVALKQLDNQSQEYRALRSQLRKTICDSENRKICCPRSAAMESKFVGRPCYGSGGPGSCRAPTRCSPENLSFSRACGQDFQCCSSASPRPPKPPPPISRAPQLPYDSSRSVAGCGVSLVDFIFGGQVAQRGAFPFMASFVYTRIGGRIESFCGGVLITERHILTAAHCFSNVDETEWRNGNIDVRLGLVNIRRRERPLAKASITKIKVHENYKARAAGYDNPIHDIAVVTLDRDIALGPASGVTTVCLPSGHGALRTNKTALVLGWGDTNKAKKKGPSNSRLNFAYIREFGREVCNNKYKRISSSRVAITEDMLCAGNEEADACAGDSGGPLLYINEEFNYEVAGIVSFGPSSCGSVIPGVYTKVENYLGWIQRETRSN